MKEFEWEETDVITYDEVMKIIDNLPQRKLEDEWESWGKVTPTYTYYINPHDLKYRIKKHFENG